MKVSVATVTYNHEPFLAQSLESAIAQRATFPFEIVVGEDGSTDGTRAVAERCAERFPERIRLLPTEKNLGLTRNTARTLAACRGDYIAILEGDDYWTHPAKLQMQADFLDGNPDCSWCFSRASVVDENGARIETPSPIRVHQPKYALAEYLGGLFRPRFCTVMYRRGLFGDFPEWFYAMQTADLPLHVFNTEAGGLIGLVDEEVAAYRVHFGGHWSQGMTPGDQLSSSPQHLRKIARRCAHSVALYEQIDRHLGGRHRAILRQKIAAFAQDWSRVSLALGDAQGAWRSAVARSRAAALLRDRFAIRPWLAVAGSFLRRSL